MTKFIPCRDATSDHAWRSISVDFIEPTATSKAPMRIQGATWNLQMWCTSTADKEEFLKSKGLDPKLARGNNPLDVSEKFNDYKKRKELQLTEIEKIIAQGNDFIFLQEADLFTNTTPVFKQMVDALLLKHGWSMEVTPQGPDHQQLVTIYNMRKLGLDLRRPSEGLFKSDVSGKFRGFQTNFIHVETGQPLSLVNLHLEYGKDYRDEMLQLQQQFATNDQPCIMGGDTNNVQNKQLNTMIGDWNAATNIASDGQGGLTTIHQPATRPGKKPIQKTYDGFFVNPGKTTLAHITEMGGTQFRDLSNGSVEYFAYIPNPAYSQHQSPVGQPWQRQKDLKRLERSAGGAGKATTEPAAPLPPRPAAPLPPTPAAPMPPRPAAAKKSTKPTAAGKEEAPPIPEPAPPALPKIFLQPVVTYYKYANQNRYHFYPATYQVNTGDKAKAAILRKWHQLINGCHSTADLENVKRNYDQSPEKAILKKGQGLWTRITGRKTDSEKAVDQMFEEAENQLSAHGNPSNR